MTSITAFFKNLGHDLRDKKLWPVAAVLLAGLVAVPVLLAKPAPPAAKGKTAVVGVAVTPVDGAVVALDGAAGTGLLQAGALKDPFIQQHLPKPPADTVTDSTGDVAAGSNSSAGDSTVIDETTTINEDNSTTINNNGEETTKARVRFGRAGVDAPERQVPAGTALPSALNPIVIYLGLQPDGKTAQFLVSSDALAQGDGSCVPSPSVCATVSMKAGQTEFFDLPSGSTSTQYQLDYLGSIVS